MVYNEDEPLERSEEAEVKYYAVRKGSVVNSCIFLFWHDCKDQVENFGGAEYSVFNNLSAAAKFLLPEGGSLIIDDLDLIDKDFDVSLSDISRPDSQSFNGTAQKSSLSQSTFTKEKHESPLTDSTLENVGCEAASRHNENCSRSTEDNVLRCKEKRMIESHTESESDVKKQRTSCENTLEGTQITPGAMALLSKNWVSSYRRLKDYYEKEGNSSISHENCKLQDDDTKGLYRFIIRQRQMYRKYKSSAAKSDTETDARSEVKIKLLRDIKFNFSEIASLPCASLRKRKSSSASPSKKKGKILTLSDNEQQKNVQGKKNSRRSKARMSQPGKQWVATYERLREYFEKHGDYSFQGRDDEAEKDEATKGLYSFSMRQRQMYRNYQDEMKMPDAEPDVVAEQKIKLLLEINFDFSEKIQKMTGDKWDEEYEKLKQFKSENGHCVIPCNHHLYRFIAAQRTQYRLLKSEKPSSLTALRIQKLTDLGVKLWFRENYYTWEERMDQLRDFKKKHSHLHVPLSDPLLGKFVMAQRYYYANALRGDKTRFTSSETKIRQLSELGFVFETGPRQSKERRGNMKSWEERFKELLAFKETNGHTNVPKGFQDNPTLAGWVKAQRFEYKKMKLETKKSRMTHEHALKLTEIGFDFDPTHSYLDPNKEASDDS